MRDCTRQSGRRVLVLGCGELGSRHLQALAALDEVTEIEIVDPRPEALVLGQERLGGGPQGAGQVRYRWLRSLSEATPGGDLCIVATLADRRPALTAEAAGRLGYRAFLLEKIVAQSIDEYERLLDLSDCLGLKMWVNCKTRAYPFHQRLKRRLGPVDPLLFVMAGGNHGLATNGLHVADLFAFYDNSTEIQLGGAQIDPILHGSKRGADLYDLSGTLIGRSARGSRLVISHAADHQGPDHLSIVTCRYRCIVDHLQRWAVESDADSGWSWRQVPYESDILVSQMTRTFARDILSSGRCDLPTLADCFVAHKFVLGALLPHFNALSGKASVQCPVT